MKREREYSFSLQKEIKMIILIFVLGSCLGVFSKYLDFHQATLPTLLQIIDQKCDLHNYLGTFGPWLMIALIISIYAPSPRSAAYLVFTFFFGMVLSYYLYCYYICIKVKLIFHNLLQLRFLTFSRVEFIFYPVGWTIDIK